jgi:hypothetical protein
MEKKQIFDEEFKQNVSDKYQAVKGKLSDALLTEEGNLDTEKIGSVVTDTAKKVEGTVREGYERFNREYVKDGKLDKEKVGAALNDTYKKGGRFLATSMTRLAEILTDKFGSNSQKGEVIDTELVELTEEND